MKTFSRPANLWRVVSAQLIAGALLASLGHAQPPPPGADPSMNAVVDYKKLLSLLPEPPEGWTAEAAEGSTDDLGETQIATVHRDYQKGTADDAPTASISILDAVTNPDYLEATTVGWTENSSDAEGYSKALTIEGMPGFEIFETDGKHGTLWLIVAKRYILQIDTTGQEAPELQAWLKRVDLKKLGEVK